jgi:hypothetical protein
MTNPPNDTSGARPLSCEQILERWTAAMAEGLTPPLELELHFADCAACARAAGELRELWDGLGHIGDDVPSAELRAGVDAMIRTWQQMQAAPAAAPREEVPPAAPLPFPARPATGRRRPLRRALQRYVLPLAAMLGGVLIGVAVSRDDRRDEVAELRADMREMRQVLAISLLDQSTASGRLEGVSMGAEVARHDSRVLAALLQTLSTDSNANVRLAAVEALAPRAGEKAVQQKLGNALKREPEPLVQIALADALLSTDDAAARRLVEPLLTSGNARPEVRQYVRRRLGGNI